MQCIALFCALAFVSCCASLRDVDAAFRTAQSEVPLEHPSGEGRKKESTFLHPSQGNALMTAPTLLQRSLRLAALHGAAALALLFLLSSCLRYLRSQTAFRLKSKRRMASASSCFGNEEEEARGEDPIDRLKGLVGTLGETEAVSLDIALQRQSALVYKQACDFVQEGLFSTLDDLDKAVCEKLNALSADVKALAEDAFSSLPQATSALERNLELLIKHSSNLITVAEGVCDDAERTGNVERATESDMAHQSAHAAMLGGMAARQLIFRSGVSPLNPESRSALRRSARAFATAIEILGGLGVGVSTEVNNLSIELTRCCNIFDHCEQSPEEISAYGTKLLLEDIYFNVSRRVSSIQAGVESASSETLSRLEELQAFFQKAITLVTTSEERVNHGAFTDAKLTVTEALIVTRQIFGVLRSSDGPNLVVQTLALRTKLLHLIKSLLPLAAQEKGRTRSKLDVIQAAFRAREVAYELLRSARELRTSVDISKRDEAAQALVSTTHAFRVLLGADRMLAEVPAGIDIPDLVIMELQAGAIALKKTMELMMTQRPHLCADAEAAADKLMQTTHGYLSAPKGN